jgi:predicted transcriptional regulator
MMVEAPISIGELADKLTILEIKYANINDPGKLPNIDKELKLLTEKWNEVFKDSKITKTQLDALYEATKELKTTNTKLWEIEDDIRECERNKNFNDDFINLARAVYVTNDRRSQIKKDINGLLGSEIVEEKSYSDYG